jgi:hypothetical protein
MQNPTPYGALRRPGVVDIHQAVHEDLVGRLAAYLATPPGRGAVVTRTVGDRERAALLLIVSSAHSPTPGSGTPVPRWWSRRRRSYGS